MQSPFREALTNGGSADDVATAIDRHAPFIAYALTDITAKSLPYVRTIILFLADGTYKVYRYDPTNTAPEDGDTVILDTDDRPFVYTQSSDQRAAPVSREYTDADAVAGTITVEDDVEIAEINLSVSAKTIALPSCAGTGGRSITIKATGTYGFTPQFSGVEACDGNSGSAYQVSTSKGYVTFTPKADRSAWMICAGMAL